MKIATSIEQLQDFLKVRQGFVPTMGALHAGHLNLITKARDENDFITVSIFVNPTQFAPSEDLSKYPRPIQSDLLKCEEAGVDLVFMPSAEEMYQKNITRILVSGVADAYEGKIRPGHFEGVSTVVAKLFHLVDPKIAYFGWKDLQQCAVIQQMVKDLNFRLELSFLDTVREPSGLALSSRNMYLSEVEKQVAPKIYQELYAALKLFKITQDFGLVERELNIAKGRLSEVGFKMEYLELIDYQLFQKATKICEQLAIIFAAKLGSTRLVDNVRLFD